MTEELFRELQQVQQYAAALSGLLSEAQAKAPQRSQAEDTAGAVTVVLDGAGMPVEVRVAEDWQRRVGPAGLGAAVVDAFGQAAQVRVAAWGRALEDGDWARKINDMMDSDVRGRRTAPRPPQASAAEAPQLFRRQQAPVTPRPVGELAEDMMKAFGEVGALAGESPLTKEFEGANGTRTVVVRLSQAGLAACTVDGGWAAGQSAAALGRAIGDALASARAKVRAAVDGPAPTGRLDSLFDEAMSLLNDPRRLAGS